MAHLLKIEVFCERIVKTVEALADHYVMLQEKMNPEEFKKSLCELILGAVQHFKAY